MGAGAWCRKRRRDGCRQEAGDRGPRSSLWGKGWDHGRGVEQELPRGSLGRSGVIPRWGCSPGLVLTLDGHPWLRLPQG